MKVGDYVKIGRGRKVYQVTVVRDDREGPGQMVRVAATADHPDAAVRVQDAFNYLPSQGLTLVRRR